MLKVLPSREVDSTYAADALSVVAAPPADDRGRRPSSAPDADDLHLKQCAPIVAKTLLHKLNTVLKLKVQKASLDQVLHPPPDPAALGKWKRFYGASLRLAADFQGTPDDAPRLLALLQEVAAGDAPPA